MMVVLQPLLLLYSRFRHHSARRSGYRPSSLKSLDRGSRDQVCLCSLWDNRASRNGDGHIHRVDHEPWRPLSHIMAKLPQPPLPFPLSPRRSLCSRRNLRSTRPMRGRIVPIRNNPNIASFVHNLCMAMKLVIGSMMSFSVPITSIFICIPRAAPESMTFAPRGALTFFSTVLGLAASRHLANSRGYCSQRPQSTALHCSLASILR